MATCWLVMARGSQHSPQLNQQLSTFLAGLVMQIEPGLGLSRSARRLIVVGQIMEFSQMDGLKPAELT